MPIEIDDGSGNLVHLMGDTPHVSGNGQFIMSDVPGEPSKSEGAVDTAIRLLKAHVPGVSPGINYQ